MLSLQSQSSTYGLHTTHYHVHMAFTQHITMYIWHSHNTLPCTYGIHTTHYHVHMAFTQHITMYIWPAHNTLPCTYGIHTTHYHVHMAFTQHITMYIWHSHNTLPCTYGIHTTHYHVHIYSTHLSRSVLKLSSNLLFSTNSLSDSSILTLSTASCESFAPRASVRSDSRDCNSLII